MFYYDYIYVLPALILAMLAQVTFLTYNKCGRIFWL